MTPVIVNVPQVLFPDLEYCLTCWKPLTEEKVIKRRWCSYACADMRPPHPNSARWPRKCLTHRGYPKIKYPYPEKVGAQGNVTVYECDYCGRYHMGHPQTDVQRRR